MHIHRCKWGIKPLAKANHDGRGGATFFKENEECHNICNFFILLAPFADVDNDKVTTSFWHFLCVLLIIQKDDEIQQSKSKRQNKSNHTDKKVPLDKVRRKGCSNPTLSALQQKSPFWMHEANRHWVQSTISINSEALQMTCAVGENSDIWHTCTKWWEPAGHISLNFYSRTFTESSTKAAEWKQAAEEKDCVEATWQQDRLGNIQTTAAGRWDEDPPERERYYTQCGRQAARRSLSTFE